MNELDEVKNARYSTEMHILKTHLADTFGFQCLQLYQVGSFKEPFHDQWYRREDRSEPCGHFDLPKNFHPMENCSRCFEGEIGCSWIQCPCCTQWYHEQCFYD